MNDYSDIINIKRPMSKHPKMPIEKRASIFNPFAALTGYEDAINEAGRIVEKKLDLTEDMSNDLSNKIKQLDKSKLVGIIYFEKDKLKDGGKYLYLKGYVSKLNIGEKYLIIDNTLLEFDNIYQITFIND
jgi:hypothetical protein